jgi:hypothetical protein
MPILGLPAAAQECRRQPPRMCLHKRLMLTKSGCQFELPLVQFGAPQVVGVVAAYLGCHHLGQLLLQHMWTSTSPIQGMSPEHTYHAIEMLLFEMKLVLTFLLFCDC